MSSNTHSAWRRVLNGVMRRRRAKDLSRSAIVFSPHPDDETLGCGGTILLKRRSGSEVRVVYITDGSRSHVPLISPEEIRAIRHEEALEACKALGIDEGLVHFMGCEDGHLEDQGAVATQRILQVLEEYRPQEVFVTHRDEPSKDHAAANRFVRHAVQLTGRPTIVWEYPIWRWNSWPWIGFAKGAWRHPWAMTKGIWRGWPSLSLLAGCNCGVDVEGVLAEKRAALEMHRSQMARHNGDPRWDVLGDYNEGRFLEMFFQPHEAFLRYELPGDRRV